MRCRARPQRVTCTRLTDAGTALRHVSFHLHIGLVLTLPAKAAKKICMLLSAPAFFRRGAAENDFSGANRHIVSQRAAHVKIWMVALGFGSASRANGNARRRAENSTGRKAHEGEHRAQHKTWVRTELSVVYLRAGKNHGRPDVEAIQGGAEATQGAQSAGFHTFRRRGGARGHGHWQSDPRQRVRHRCNQSGNCAEPSWYLRLGLRLYPGRGNAALRLPMGAHWRASAPIVNDAGPARLPDNERAWGPHNQDCNFRDQAGNNPRERERERFPRNAAIFHVHRRRPGHHAADAVGAIHIHALDDGN